MYSLVLKLCIVSFPLFSRRNLILILLLSWFRSVTHVLHLTLSRVEITHILSDVGHDPAVVHWFNFLKLLFPCYYFIRALHACICIVRPIELDFEIVMNISTLILSQTKSNSV